MGCTSGTKIKGKRCQKLQTKKNYDSELTRCFSLKMLKVISKRQRSTVFIVMCRVFCHPLHTLPPSPCLLPVISPSWSSLNPEIGALPHTAATTTIRTINSTNYNKGQQQRCGGGGSLGEGYWDHRHTQPADFPRKTPRV